jgi:hypothetical protein
MLSLHHLNDSRPLRILWLPGKPESPDRFAKQALC